MNLFPLFLADLEIELGGEAWLKLIGKYRSFAKPQKSNIPSFHILNKLFDPKELLIANQKSKAREVHTDVEANLDMVNNEEPVRGDDNFEKEKDKVKSF